MGMKIAHITTIDMSLSHLLLNQLCSIRQAGYEVVGISSSGPEVPVIEAAGIRHIPVSMTRRLTPINDFLCLCRLCQIMCRERFIIVHTHNPKPGVLGQIAARMAGVPIVVNTLHGLYCHASMHRLWRGFYMLLEKTAARCSDVILSQNREDIGIAIGEGICRSEKMIYLGNGIDLGVYNPKRFSNRDIAMTKAKMSIRVDSPVVGFVGRLAAKRKGFLDFLAAAKEVSRRLPNVRYLIIGTADHGKPDAVEPSAAADYDISELCLFLGHRPNYELPVLYRIMDLLVLPSLFEGVPRVVMEASAMQVPAVVTDVKGNREAVEHGRNGLLVAPGDVHALANAMVELLTDSERSGGMGEVGREIALKRFDERIVFKKVRAEYKRLLRAKGYPLPQEGSNS